MCGPTRSIIGQLPADAVAPWRWEVTDRGGHVYRPAAYYLALAEAGPPEPGAVPLGRWWDSLEAEHANFRAAREWCAAAAPDDALRLAVALSEFLRLRGHLGEARVWLEQGVGLVRSDDAQARPTTAAQQVLYGRALMELCHCAAWHGAHAAASAAAEAAVRILRHRQDVAGLIGALPVLASTYLHCGDVARAQETSAESQALVQQQGADDVAVGWTLFFQGVLDYTVNDGHRAARWWAESARRLGAGRELCGLAYALIGGAALALDQGNAKEAATALEEGLSTLATVGERWGSVHGIEVAARLAVVMAERQTTDARTWALRAARLFGAAEALRETLGAQLLAFHRRSRDPGVAGLRALLDGAAVEAAWASGRGLTLEQAVTDARAVSATALDDVLGQERATP